MLTNRVREAYYNCPPYVYWDNFFTEDELASIDTYLQTLPLTDGKIGEEAQQGTLNPDVRKSSVSFVQYNADSEWIFYRLFALTEMINSHFYNFNLLGFDHLQYTVYDSEGSHYDYHIDMFGNTPTNQVPRKLSFTLILSDSSEYEGGDFEVMAGNSPTIAEQKRGRVLAFPSFVLHRVAPVKKGVRRSLVFWACGPKFK